MLAALGWDVTDVDHVVRESRVFDNTALDYALKIDDGGLTDAHSGPRPPTEPSTPVPVLHARTRTGSRHLEA